MRRFWAMNKDHRLPRPGRPPTRRHGRRKTRSPSCPSRRRWMKRLGNAVPTTIPSCGAICRPTKSSVLTRKGARSAGVPVSADLLDKRESRIRGMFGAIAPYYDLLNHLLSLNVDRYWRWRTVRAARPDGDSPILDLCTGTGDLALAYHRAGHGRSPVIGADFCHEMLALGDQKRRRAGINGQVTFVEADAQRLPFPDNHFQIVSVAFGLRNVTDTDRGLAEMARVCRPGGRVAVLEFSMPRWRPFRGIYAWYFRHV